MNPIVLVAESGSDITPELAKEYGIEIVPMHVSFAGETRDDGAFPVTEMFDYYKKHRELPRTSGCTPHDFEEAFARIEREHPGCPILHLAYSSCTTCSLQSAKIAAEERTDVTFVDTKSVTAGQAAIVLAVAQHLREHPETTVQEAAALAEALVARVRMGFFPGDLDYLRAGGRVSNAAYMGAKILGLHPLIEILDGKLMSTKKYRGAMHRVCAKLAREYPVAQKLSREQVYLIYGEGLAQEIRDDAEAAMRDLGFKKITWVRTGCVIAAHSGPGAFGVVGFEEA